MMADVNMAFVAYILSTWRSNGLSDFIERVASNTQRADIHTRL